MTLYAFLPIKACCRSSVLFVFTIALFACKTQNNLANQDLNSTFSEKPNILWLVAEDMGPYIEPFGDSTIHTPNLSRLAAEGLRYTNVYSVSGVCSPSRSAIATGMYPNHIGAHNMTIGNVPREMMNNPMIKEFFKKYMPKELKPYEVVPPPYVKMHSEFLREQGYYCTNNVKEDYQFKASPTSWDQSSSTAHWRNKDTDQPFFAVFNFMVTHESRVWMRSSDSLWVDEDLEVPIPPYLQDSEIARKNIRRMYSNILEMDHQVGELLQQLEEDGELDNTVIFWYTDHGGPLPRQKRLLYDSGLNVPMIIRFPEQQFAGQVDDQMISFIDFLPTLLSILDINPPTYIDGQAFLGSYKLATPREFVHAAADRFDEHSDRIRAVRNNRFKYLRNFQPEKPYYLPLSFREQMPIMKELLQLRDEGKLNSVQSQWFRDSKPEEELFDVMNDPYELHNLADDPEYASILAELRNECDSWMNEIDDKGAIDEKDIVESFWPGGIQPKSKTPTLVEKDGLFGLITDEPGSSIGYQIIGDQDGLSDSWMMYKEEVQLETDQTLHALAHRKGYLVSDTITYSLIH